MGMRERSNDTRSGSSKRNCNWRKLFMTANLLACAPHLFYCGIALSGAYNRTLAPFKFQASGVIMPDKATRKYGTYDNPINGSQKHKRHRSRAKPFENCNTVYGCYYGEKREKAVALRWKVGTILSSLRANGVTTTALAESHVASHVAPPLARHDTASFATF
ncbi:hypothetical protein Tco_1022250 [Tanacetum coccineum]